MIFSTILFYPKKSIKKKCFFFFLLVLLLGCWCSITIWQRAHSMPFERRDRKMKMVTERNTNRVQSRAQDVNCERCRLHGLENASGQSQPSLCANAKIHSNFVSGVCVYRVQSIPGRKQHCCVFAIQTAIKIPCRNVMKRKSCCCVRRVFANETCKIVFAFVPESQSTCTERLER